MLDTWMFREWKLVRNCLMWCGRSISFRALSLGAYSDYLCNNKMLLLVD